MSWLGGIFGSKPQLTPEQASRLAAWRALPEVLAAAELASARLVVVDVETSGLKLGRDWLIARQDLEKFEKRPQGNFKLSAEQIREIRYMAKDGQTPLELARKFKVSVRTIYRHMNK